MAGAAERDEGAEAIETAIRDAAPDDKINAFMRAVTFNRKAGASLMRMIEEALPR